ncbi:glycosyl transferase family 28, partial [Actinomadura sp. KC345]
MTFPTKAHLYAQVPVAWALRSAGHEVCVASRPDLVEDITRTGLTAVPVGEVLDLESRLREGGVADAPDGRDLLTMDELRPERATYDALHGLFTVLTTEGFPLVSSPDTIDQLVGFAREWRPDLLIWDPQVIAGGVAARVCGAAHARLLYGLD